MSAMDRVAVLRRYREGLGQNTNKRAGRLTALYQSSSFLGKLYFCACSTKSVSSLGKTDSNSWRVVFCAILAFLLLDFRKQPLQLVTGIERDLRRGQLVAGGG